MVYTPFDTYQADFNLSVKDPNSNLHGQINNLERELSAARRKEEKLSRLLEEATQENEQLNEYIATIAHEMNNPLHIASSYINYLLKQDVELTPEIQQDYLTAATSGIKQAQVLLQDLLCDSQMLRQELDIDLKPVDLRLIVREVYKQFKLFCRISRLELVGSGLSGPACMTLGSANRLQQVLYNLLTNAIKFSPERGEIQLKLSLQDDNYLIEVIDQGPGLSPENRGRVFERRFQVKESSGIYHAGYGLGLSITMNLIELQGGSIGVESEPDRGSRFWFTLPAISQENEGF
jgi:signal transduction histidine kinase